MSTAATILNPFLGLTEAEIFSLKTSVNPLGLSEYDYRERLYLLAQQGDVWAADRLANTVRYDLENSKGSIE